MSSLEEIVIYNESYAGLAWGFQVDPDSCGNHEHYEEYIRLTAINDHNAGLGTTHAFIRQNEETGEKKLLGYITLRATSYIKTFEGVMHGSPALEIFELAVDKTVEHEGIGTILVKFALAKAHELNQSEVGIQYVTLCADELAVPFYEKMGFARMDDYGDVPRDNWNVDCVPMFIKLGT